MSVEVFEVGGCVRDSLLGVSSKDIDYSCIANSFEDLLAFVEMNEFKIVLIKPEYGTIRAITPKTGFRGYTGVIDFVWAREEGPYSDGRRPDWTKPTDLLSDLRRRDFTVNAMARNSQGILIDPFGGQVDLRNRELRAVGNAEDRIREDALRALRAIRFAVTKQMHISHDIRQVLYSDWLPPLLSSVSVERIREELDKAFAFDTILTLDIFEGLSLEFKQAVFRSGLRLQPTLKQ